MLGMNDSTLVGRELEFALAITTIFTNPISTPGQPVAGSDELIDGTKVWG